MARRRKTIGALPRGVRPNAGLTDIYRQRLDRLIDEMHRSFLYWIKAAYRRNEPAMAMDDLPAAELQRVIRKLSRQWQRRFNEGADELAKFFAQRVRDRSDRQLMAILKRAGFTVSFKLTPRLRDVMRASVQENVQLIKSIPQQYLTGVQGDVMRSVAAGRDLATLTKALQEKYGSTKKRAKLIALDQNNKATSAIQKARQVDLGITHGIWMHSHAGKEPRPTHLANDGKRFSVVDGWFDPDPKVRQRIMPGELINCRCTWRPIVAGFDS